MRKTLGCTAFLSLVVLLSGCAQTRPVDESYPAGPAAKAAIEVTSIDLELQAKILAMDPDRVTGKDVEEVLSQAPAPQLLNIRGGIYPAHLWMIDFSTFLIGMGYPADRIRDPSDGAYSYSSYGSSVELAGTAAWYYERDGLRPMIVGHSLGGIQAVKVLYQLAGRLEDTIPVYDPITDQAQPRYTIVDPLTGEERPVVGLSVSYVAAVGAGGAGRLWPNVWDMNGRLTSIPDAVEGFTAFHIPGDLLGGDLLGVDANRYRANGKAEVRNVVLPSDYSHFTVIFSDHLVESAEIRDWIDNDYIASENPEIDRTFDSSTENILYAADVWHSIKKYWVLELQRLIRQSSFNRSSDP